MVDVITNSSTEIFCQITSENFLDKIQEGLSDLLGRPIDLTPLLNDEWEETDKSCIEFEIEYNNDDYVTNDFINLIEFYLNVLVGKNNYKINKGEY